MSFDIQGKTALITGANRGIGKSILESFLQHGAAKVYAAVRNVDSAAPLVAEHGGKVVPVQVDLGEPDTIAAAARSANDVEVVVNNAGVLRTATPLADDAVDSLRDEFDINVLGLIRIAQVFAPLLKANGGGAFVQLNSVASLKCFVPIGTYSASKAASYSITQGLREMLAPQGTAVLSVHPGPINTEMAQTAGFGDIAESPSLVADGIVEALRAGEFHLFPDSTAKEIGMAYQSFAENVIEAETESNA